MQALQIVLRQRQLLNPLIFLMTMIHKNELVRKALVRSLVRTEAGLGILGVLRTKLADFVAVVQGIWRRLQNRPFFQPWLQENGVISRDNGTASTSFQPLYCRTDIKSPAVYPKNRVRLPIP